MVMTNNKSIRLLSSVFIITILTSACGGSGDSGPNVNGGNTPPLSDDLNPDLSGKLFFIEKSKRTDGSKITEAWTMDIATGKYVKVPNTNWADHDDLFPGNWDRPYVAPVDYDGTEFIVEISECKTNPDRSCIAIQDENGNYLGQFDVFGDAQSATISRDRQYIALFRDSLSVDQGLEIYDRNGTLLSRTKLRRTYYAWLTDGRIIYVVGRSFHFTTPYSTQAKYSLTLPSTLPGEKIYQIAVSPDGARLAFTVDGVPYIVNIYGAGIRKLAEVSNGETTVNGLAWSPDGQWILLAEGNNIATTPLGPSASRRFYAVPAEDMGKFFTLSPHESDRSPEIRLLRRYWFSDGPTYTNGSITDQAFSTDVYWLP